MAECACIYVDDFDSPEMYRSTMQTARKPHKCCECGKTITPKEKYEYVCGIWEGTFDTHKTCIVCKEIRDTFFCDGWLFEGLFEYLYNHINDMDGIISESCISELSPKAREVICGIIEEYWEQCFDDEDDY